MSQWACKSVIYQPPACIVGKEKFHTEVAEETNSSVSLGKSTTHCGNGPVKLFRPRFLLVGKEGYYQNVWPMLQLIVQIFEFRKILHWRWDSSSEQIWEEIYALKRFTLPDIIWNYSSQDGIFKIPVVVVGWWCRLKQVEIKV